MAPSLHIGPLILQSWPLLVTAGVLICWALLLVRTSRMGYSPARVFLWLLLAFPVGALSALIAERAIGAAIGRSDGRMTVIGSIVGCTVFSVGYIRFVFREPTGRLLDAAAFTFPLAMLFGRTACLLNGCCYGKIAALRLPLVTMPLSAYAAESGARQHYLNLDAGLYLWNLPLLLLTCALLVLIGTEWMFESRRYAPGSVFLAAVALDGFLRSVAELAREAEPLPWCSLHPFQLAALLIGVVASIELLRRNRARGTYVDSVSGDR